MNDFKFDQHQGHIRPSWNSNAMLIRGPLTDKKIEKYSKQGWYSSEYKQARKERMNRKPQRRNGPFVEVDGRWIYSP